MALTRSALSTGLLCGGVLLGVLCAHPAQAEDPLIKTASAEKHGMGWRVTVTLEHPDVDWKHFADAWRIEDRFGKVLGLRDLMHPHVDEQPFTRSLNNVQIPDGTRVIYVRARCNQDDWSHAAIPVSIQVSGS
ncbi:MAG: hypothetical protein ACPGVS_00400 [Primorskyibacter sp.]